MKNSRKEMENISLALEKILNGEALDPPAEYTDTLHSKITHQLFRLDEMLRAREKQAAIEHSQIKELIAEIAHQMRMPLANLESYTELLAGALENDSQRHYLEAVCKSEQQLKFLTESFIKTARLENRIIQIKKESIYLKDTILKSILTASRAAEAKHIDIRLEASPEISAPHDAGWLGEAIYNLIDNSIKYSPENSAVTVSAAADEMYVRIVVSDFGAGISEDEENRIFKRFYRGKNTNGQPGFGLGLYISREIVMLHDGVMKARRRADGLDMYIFLPVSQNVSRL